MPKKHSVQNEFTTAITSLPISLLISAYGDSLIIAGPHLVTMPFANFSDDPMSICHSQLRLWNENLSLKKPDPFKEFPIEYDSNYD